MTIDRVDQTVVTQEPPAATGGAFVAAPFPSRYGVPRFTGFPRVS